MDKVPITFEHEGVTYKGTLEEVFGLLQLKSGTLRLMNIIGADYALPIVVGFLIQHLKTNQWLHWLNFLENISPGIPKRKRPSIR